MAFSDESLCSLSSRTKQVVLSRGSAEKYTDAVLGAIAGVITSMKSNIWQDLDNIDEEILQCVKQKGHDQFEEINVSYKKEALVNEILEDSGKILKSCSTGTHICRKKIVSAMNKLATNSKKYVRQEDVGYDTKEGLLAILKEMNFLIPVPQNQFYLNTLDLSMKAKLSTESFSILDCDDCDNCYCNEKKSNCDASFTVSYALESPLAEQKWFFQCLSRALCIIASPSLFLEREATFQLGLFDVTITLTRPNILDLSAKMFSEMNEQMTQMALNAMVAFKLVVDHFCLSNGFAFSYRLWRYAAPVIQSLSDAEINHLTVLTGIPFYEFTKDPFDSLSATYQKAFNGFPTVSPEISGRLWHMYCSGNPQFVSLHGTCHANTIMFGNKNIINSDGCDGIYFPLSPLNPVNNSKVTLNFPIGLGSTKFYVGGKHLAFVVDLKTGAMKVVKESNKWEENWNFLENSDSKPYLNRVSLAVSLYKKINSESCHLRFETPFHHPITIEVPNDTYHFGTYQEEDRKTTLNYFLTMDSVPTPSMIASFDGILSKCCAWQKNQRLEALDKMTGGIICGATITEVVPTFVDGFANVQIKIHFDGWSKRYDYTTNTIDEAIHPLKYTMNNDAGMMQSPKNYCLNEQEQAQFSWLQYLEDINCSNVPPYLFTKVQKGERHFDIFHFECSDPKPFRFGQLLEVSDGTDQKLQAAMVVRNRNEQGRKEVGIMLLEYTNKGNHGRMGNMLDPGFKYYEETSDKLHPVGYHQYLLLNPSHWKETLY